MSHSPLQAQAVDEPAAWDACLLSLPEPHVLQSWAWGESKLQTGWTATRLVWGDNARVQASQPDAFSAWAAASLLVRRLNRRVPVAIAYVPKGPLLDWSDEALRERVIDDIERVTRQAGAFFVKIDPDVPEDTPTGRAVAGLLKRRGWTPSPEQIQYRNTVISDLSPDEETLLAAMKPKWRYNIRLAERKGIIVRNGGPADAEVFYRMYAETGERDGFLVRPFGYYETVWRHFMAQRLAHMLLAEVDGQPVAGLILFRFGPTAWYFYGASTANARDLMPNHALQWAAMRWAKAQGCTRYDWWGAPEQLSEDDPMWGVYRFKQGFGGEFTRHIGAWDYPANRALYWGYMRAMPKVLDLMRRRHRTAA